MKLKPCPCGKTPNKLCVSESNTSKWGYVCGDCCGEWNVEFRTDYRRLDTKECMELAIEEWNSAPRTVK